MREFFLSQMDYVFFVYGLAFILLFSVCTALHKKSKTPIPWEWLGAFGLIHGLHEWVELLALSPSHSDSFHGICVAMLGVSFFCLFEFGRLTCERLKYFRLGRWIYIPLCLTVFSAASFGLSGVNAAIRYSFGFSGGLLSALALWRSSRESKDRRGWAMVWAAAAMGVYAVAAGGVAPKTGVFLADMINHDTFFKWAGFPVQILRAFAACAFSVAIVVYHKDSLRESVPHPAGYGKHLMVAALLALLATLVAGWFWTDYEGQREATLQKAQLLSDAQQSVVAVDPQLVRDLSGSAADVQTVAYQALKSRLQNLREVMTSIRFIYLMREVDGKIVFLVDSETGGYKDESPPGQVYDEATTTMHEALASGRAMVEPPTTDRWGCWISAYVPLKDGHTGELLAVLGVDQSARNFEEAVAVARLKGIVPVGILCFGFLFMFAFWERFVFAVGPGKEGREPDLWVKWVMVAIVGVIGLTLTILLFLEFQESAESAFKTIFLQRAITRAESISKELDRQVDRLDGLRRFMHSRELVGRSEFNEYVAPLSKDVPIRAFEWIPRVARGDRVFYESSARQDNCEGFQIYEKDALGNKIPALDREEYFPVYYVDPLKGNEEALGYDLASEPVRRAAMEKSRDWGSAVATPPIELVQRGKKSTGILIFMPVYAKDLPHRTLEQRRNSLKGFVLVVYNADDFLKGVYERMPLEGLACLMEDLAAPAGRQVLLRQEVNGEEVDWRRPVMKYAMSLEIPDRQWRVTLVPSKVFSERLLSRVYGWVLPIGFFLTALVALFLNFLMMSRYRAERLVNLRTDELKQEKETLRASEESYRKQFANNVAMMLLIDPQEGTILDANAAALEFYGYPRERLLAMKITDINTLPAAEVRQALSSVVPGKGHLFQFQNRRAEGSVRDVEMAVSSIQFGSCIVLHAIIFDITERKRAAEALRENEEKFRHLIETTRTGFLVLDGQG
ncbi:MAG: CHASE domain-containing protein, partial [Candidatus Omnitrophota bacterium]